MQKGVVIQVQIFISGDDAPAHDFSQTGHDVALQLLQQGLQHYTGPYSIQVQKVQPVEGGDDDSDEPASGDALDVKPLLSYTPASSATAAPPSTSASAPAGTSPAATAGSSTAASAPAPQSPAQPHPQPPHPQQPPSAQGEQPEEQPKHHFWDR